jgi:hypothetical protein
MASHPGPAGCTELEGLFRNLHLDPGMQVIAKPFVMAAFANKVAEMIEA